MRLVGKTIAAWAVLVSAIAASGCACDGSRGYSFESLYPDNISTVAVPIWKRGSSVYRRNAERQLTEAIIKRIEADTPYKVTDKAHADTLLEGMLVNIQQRVMSFNPANGLPRDVELTYFVDFTWTDLGTGQILVRREKFRATGVYYPTDPFHEGDDVGLEDTSNEAARRIVETLEKPI